MKATPNFVLKLMRKSCAATLAVLLLPHPWTTQAVAEQNNWVQTSAQAIQGITGAMQGAMMQAQMMAPIDLSPSMMRNVPAANMPVPLNKCIIPQSEIPMPRYCENPGNPGEFTSVPDLSMSPSYRAYAQTREFAHKMATVDLARMLDPAKNEFANGAITGVKCLEDARKKEKTRRQGILNAIQAKIAQIKERNELFQEQAKLVEMEMDQIKGDLFGVQSGSSHVTAKLNPPITNLPAGCQEIIEQSSNGNPATAGLYQLRDEALKPAAREGGNFLANETLYRNDIQRFIAQAQSHVSKHGIDSFLATGMSEFKGNPELSKRLKASLDPFVSRIKGQEKKIRDELRAVGYDAPSMDQHFSSDFEAFRADAENYFRKQFIHECVTKADSGVGIAVEDVLKNLRQESTQNQGTTIIEYRAALEVILKSDSFIEDKLDRIKKLDEKYGIGNITFSYVENGDNHVNPTPYQYFTKVINRCEQRFAQDDTFSTSAQGRSAATKIARAKEYLNDLKKIHDGFTADLTTEITNEVLNCSGRSTEAGSCSLKSGAFSVASSGFCFANANACATRINSCFKAADEQVKKKNTELNAKADVYNGLVQALFADQKRFFAEFQASVMGEAGLLNALVPGADFVFPADMFVSMPELALDPKSGVYLRGGNAQSIGQQLDLLAGKMDKLKGALEKQGQLADKELQSYVDAQAKSMNELQKKFQAVVKACDQRLQEAEGIVMNFNNERSGKEQQARGTAGEFCSRFYDLSTNPMAGCDDIEDLYSKATEAVAYIDKSARNYVNEYRNLCKIHQNELEKGTEDDGANNSTLKRLANQCRNGKEWNSIIEPLKKDLLAQLPAGEDKNKISNFLEKTSIDPGELDRFIKGLSSDFKDEFENEVDMLRTLAREKFDNKYNFEKIKTSMIEKLDIDINKEVLEKALKDNKNDKLAQKLSGANGPKEALDAYKKLVNCKAGESCEADKKKYLEEGASYDKEKELYAKHLQTVFDRLEKEKSGDGCTSIKADAYLAAAKTCKKDDDDKCLDKEYDKIMEKGDSTPLRNIASLLDQNSQSHVQEVFSSLGETRSFHCDALAQNKRSTISDLEAFDRSILGDDIYNDLGTFR